MSQNLTALLLGYALMTGVLGSLTACGEAAQCWNDAGNRYTNCDDMRRDEITQEIDRREMERGRP